MFKNMPVLFFGICCRGITLWMKYVLPEVLTFFLHSFLGVEKTLLGKWHASYSTQNDKHME